MPTDEQRAEAAKYLDWLCEDESRDVFSPEVHDRLATLLAEREAAARAGAVEECVATVQRYRNDPLWFSERRVAGKIEDEIQSLAATPPDRDAADPVWLDILLRGDAASAMDDDAARAELRRRGFPDALIDEYLRRRPTPPGRVAVSEAVRDRAHTWSHAEHCDANDLMIRTKPCNCGLDEHRAAVERVAALARLGEP